jgi:protocatechuate 3,4-dioxygenase beta subunit
MRRGLVLLFFVLVGPQTGSVHARPDPVRHAGALVGVVQDEAGQAVPGARVALYVPPPLPPVHRGWRSQPRLERRELEDLPPPPGPLSEARADAQGRFRLDGLDPTRRVVMLASAEGLAGEPVGTWVDGGFDPRRLVVRKAHSAVVRVVDAGGKPLEARVEVHRRLVGASWDEGPFVVAAAATDVEGRARLTRLLPGRVTVQVVVPGRGMLREHAIDVPSVEPVTLRFGDATGAAVSGVVTDADGRPLAGAWVTTGAHASRVNEDDPVHQVWTRSDAAGAWRVEGLAGRRFLGVGVSMGGYVASADVEEGRRLAPGDQVRVDVVMGRAGRIRGRVLRSDGLPAAGIDVDVGGRGVVSGADGAWEMGGMSARLTYVRVSGPGDASSPPSATWDDAPGTWVEARPDEVVTVPDLLVDPEREIRGRVVDEGGRPVAGAWVALGREASILEESSAFRPDAATWSAADGTYVLRAACRDDYVSLRAETPDRVGLTSSAPVSAGVGPLRCDVHVEPLGRMEVSTVDLGGRPVPGMGLRLQGPEERIGAAGADGLAVFDRLRSGTYVVKPSYEQRRHKELPEVERRVGVGEHVHDVRLRLDPPRGLSGVVVDEEGRPAAGVGVRLKADEPFVFTDRWQTEESWWHWGTETDGAGAFRFENLAPGGYWIEPSPLAGDAHVEAGESGLRLVWYRDAVPEPDGPHVDRVNRWSTEGALVRVAGVVLDPAGRPVHEASARLTTHASNATRSWSVGVRQGTFVGMVEEGAERLDVEVDDVRDASGRALHVARAVVENVRIATGRLEIRLSAAADDPEAHAIRGRVVDREDRPVAGVAVQAGRPSESWHERLEDAVAAATDGDGRFRVFPIAPGSWTVRCLPGGPWEGATTTAPTGAAEVLLRLVPARWIEGRVLDPAGRPVPGVRVEGGSVRTGTTFDGTFRLGPVTGSVDVQAGSTSDEGQNRAGEEFRQRRPLKAVAGATGVEITLERVAAIEGTVVDGRGRRLGDVEVRLEPESGETGRSPRTTEQDWSQRTFRFDDVAPGRWRLTASDEEGRRSKPVLVEAPAVGLRIVFDAPPVVAGRLAGPESGGFQVLLITSRADGGRANLVPTDADGAFSLESEDLAPRLLFASKPGDERYALLERAQPGDAPFDVPLAKGGHIQGTITGTAMPADPSGAFVSAVSPRGLRVQAVVRADGGFAFRGLPPGEPWDVSVLLAVGDTLRRGRAQGVAVGTTDLVLRVEEP